MENKGENIFKRFDETTPGGQHNATENNK